MPILNLNDPAIKELLPGQFAIPNLDWNEEIPFVIGGNDSIKAMTTNMYKHGHSLLINKIKVEIGDQLNTENLSNLIEKRINEYYKINSNELLLEIFHLIQLWGGKAGRQFYFKKTKIKIEYYKRFVETVISTRNIEHIINQTKIFIQSTSNINIAFITKHVSFWQRCTPSALIQLPIYDSIIAKNIMGKYVKNKNSINGYTYNDFKHLHIYWQEMLGVSINLGIPMNNIERQTFNFFRNGTPDSWPRQFS
jgi:hypothetical protein